MTAPTLIPAAEALHARGIAPGAIIVSDRWSARARILEIDDVLGVRLAIEGGACGGKRKWSSYQWRRRVPSDVRVQPPEQEPTVVECGCGCGATFERLDRWGRVRRFVVGHGRWRAS